MPASAPPAEPPLAADPDAGVGLYLHWPYCERICPYCDFNVRKTRAIDAAAWRTAFRREMEHMADLRGRPAAALTSVYFGGGTPSLMPPDLVAGVIEDTKQVFGLVPDAEISLEANPTSSEAARFAALCDTGVTRLSLGIQSFDDAALRFLGRNHSTGEARDALARAQDVFPNTTFDLIYGLPDQSRRDWEAALGEALALSSGHVSLYQLTIEDGTAFGAAARRGRLVPRDDDTLADFYDATQDITAAAGLPGYEVSNHAAPGMQGRHNLTYWRYGEYVGIGPGAHGRLVVAGSRYATETIADPAAWLAATEQHGHGIAEESALDAAACGTELLLMGLRLAEGIPGARFAAVAGRTLADVARLPRVADLIGQGLLDIDESRMTATPDGRRVLNALVAALSDALSW